MVPNDGHMRGPVTSDIKATLSSLKREEWAQKRRGPEQFAAANSAFRNAVSNRLKARGLLTTGATPITPASVTLDTPFLIWAFHDGGPANILSDTHIEPQNSWARFISQWKHGGPFLGHDEVDFFFLWQNDTGSDAVVDVESQLMLAGRSSVFADSGLILSPFWGQGTSGSSRLRIESELTILEWWNQPPTRPLQQPSQLHEVIDMSADGGWIFLGSGNGDSEWLSGSHHVHYDMFLIPMNAVAVFEVSLNMYYSGSKGDGSVDFQSAEEPLTCPYVQLTTPTSPLRNA